MNPTNDIINNFSEQLNYISPEVEDTVFHRRTDLQKLTWNQTHMNKLEVVFLKRLFLFTRVYRKYEAWIIDGFFKQKQENNFPITQTQCVMDDYNSLEQSVWSQNLNNKSPYLLKTLGDLHFCWSGW